MLCTKINIAKQLDAADEERFACRIAKDYVLAPMGMAAGGFAVLMYVVRWW